MTVARELAKCTEGFGLVGRFGGDELLLIDLKNVTPEEKNVFFEELYTSSAALRVNIDFENGSAYVTATIGVASYPEDADNFDELFGLIDKMLYLGKSRGRNCYSVYDHEKHKNLEITELSRHDMYSSMNRLKDILESVEGTERKMREAMPFLAEIMQTGDFYYVGPDGKMRAVNDEVFEAKADDIGRVMEGDLFADSTLERVEKNSPAFYSALQENGFGSALVVRIRKRDVIYGYLVCAARREFRIWQDNECAIMYYVAGALAEFGEDL